MKIGALFVILFLGIPCIADSGDLMEAVSKGNIQKVKELIDSGANVNLVDHGTSILSMAVNHGNVGMIKYLLSRGADVNLRDSDGATPLNSSPGPVKNRYEVVASLIKAGAEVNTKDKNGETPLEKFAWKSDDDVK